MSFISSGLQLAGSILRANLSCRVAPLRLVSTTAPRLEEAEREKREVDPSRRRDREIPVETSIRYMKSDAYKEAYKDLPVWKLYRRNFKGPFAPRQTRKTCIRSGVISTGNPCPICRDEYLVVDYKNIDLLKQFISEQTGNILETRVTGVCRKQHTKLQIAIQKAFNTGLLSFDVPFIHYNYSEWYSPEDTGRKETGSAECGTTQTVQEATSVSGETSTRA